MLCTANVSSLHSCSNCNWLSGFLIANCNILRRQRRHENGQTELENSHKFPFGFKRYNKKNREAKLGRARVFLEDHQISIYGELPSSSPFRHDGMSKFKL